LQNPQTSTSETPTTSKRKGNFNIGLYAKRRKQITEDLVNERVMADIKVKRLQNKLSYTKQKVQYFCFEMFFNYSNDQFEQK
jgi:uncharacterized protein YbaA (DUF1428 family)